MVNLKRKLLAGAMAALIASAGAFAQRGDDKRPPKGNNKVVAGDKQKPPQNSNNRGGGDKNKGDKRGKPD
ncbi:MAG TPA: hypothetical protein VE135_11985 [Pyrinomonadaceae bacterium]|nr:hypothetical protein [Pyrinomonadaceae bacterium]